MLDFWGVAKKKLALATLPFPLQELTNLKIGHPKRNLVLKPSIFRCEMLVSGRVNFLRFSTTWVSQNLEVRSRDDEEPRRKGNRLSNKGAIELPRLRVFLGVCYFGLAAVSFKEGNIYLGGGFRYFLEFSPRKIGEMIQFDLRIFLQMGWFSHQLSEFFLPHKKQIPVPQI